MYDLMMLAHFFKHPHLPLQLLFDALIPNMTLQSSLHVLKYLPSTLSKHLPDLSLPHSPSLLHLLSYSSFHLSLHLPSQLLSSRQPLLSSLSLLQLSQILQQSLSLISGPDTDNRDLSLLISFATDTFGDGNIYKLLRNVSRKTEGC